MSFLPGSERYRRVETPPIPRANDPVVIANRIPIHRILRDLWQSDVPMGLGHRSWKTYCPLGWEHPDGGVDKGFRVYEQTNNAYCFVMHGSMTPVRLAQMCWGGKPRNVARKLMEQYGLGRRYWKERYEEILQEYESRDSATQSAAYLVEALHTALSNIPGYIQIQYKPGVVSEMENELLGLDSLMGQHPSDEQIRVWYQNARQRLAHFIEVEVSRHAGMAQAEGLDDG